ADDVIVTVPNMRLINKADATGIFRSGHMKFHRYETSEIRIRIYGDAAVVTGRLLRTRKLNDQNVEDKWRFTKTYIRRDGKWQVVAWHASTTAP
ncbi:MAG TPA: nuclear transport factor 2 family protein, partial [Blastocatellia bacterium]